MPVDPAHTRLHPPKQARSRRTLEKLERATLELLAREGVEGTTVAAVVERAGSSVGSFYARFPGKEELLLHLQDRIWDEALKAWEEALGARDWEALELDDVAEEVVRILLTWHREGAGRRRMLGEYARRRAEAGAEGGEGPERRFHRHVLRDLRRIVLRRSEEVRHPSPELGVQLGYRILLGAVRELSEQARTGGGPVDDDLLVRELARCFLAYLGVDVPERDVHEGEADFGDPFDVWG